MARLSQTNPELFTNPTLGEANPTTFLDEEVAQNIEDKQARRDKREPLVAKREVRYPVWAPATAVPSSVGDVVNLHDPDSNEIVVEGTGKVMSMVLSDGNPPVADYSRSLENKDEDENNDDDSDVDPEPEPDTNPDSDYTTEVKFPGE